jgi:hypothetical protein
MFLIRALFGDESSNAPPIHQPPAQPFRPFAPIPLKVDDPIAEQVLTGSDMVGTPDIPFRFTGFEPN